MILTCPECGAKYMVSQDTIGEKGRDVRCSKCSHIWHQRSERDSLDDLINRIQSEELDEIDFGDGTAVAKAAAQKEKRKKFAALIARIKEMLKVLREFPARKLASLKYKFRTGMGRLAGRIRKILGLGTAEPSGRSIPKGIMAGLVLFVVCTAIALAAHAPIEKIYPPSKPVFNYILELAGMGSEASEKMPQIQELLTFDHLEYGHGLHGENATLSGTLINLSANKLTIPPVYVEVMGKENQVLWGGFVDIGTAALDGEAQIDFKVKLQDAHIEGASILEVWFRAKTDAKGYNKEPEIPTHSGHSSEDGAG